MGLGVFIATWVPGAKIERIEGWLLDPATGLDLIGHELIWQYRAAFKDQRWDGIPWNKRPCPNVIGALADLVNGMSEPKPHRLKKGPALVDSSTLMGNASFNRIDRYTIIHGSNLDYSSPHNEGEPSTVGPVTMDVQRRLWAWVKRIGTKTSVCGETMAAAFGWLLNKKMAGEVVEVDHPQRQFVGLTDDTRKRIAKGLQRMVAQI